MQVAVDDRGRPVTVDDTAIEEVLDIWRIDDEWWREPITRRYVEVVLEGGAHLVLFEDLRQSAWFAQMP
ncbi:MAG: hypothetical protein IH616_23740 [Gemmatimonadales bacterium]|nr:hypothetical protein [Gemmatimonadales bacterium]